MNKNTSIHKTDPLGNITYGVLASEEITTFICDTPTPVTVESIGITHPNPRYFIERKHNDYYVFEYVLSGKGYIINDGKSYEVGAGDVYILEKGFSHKYWGDQANPFEKIFINVFGDILGNILTAYGLSGVTVFHAEECKRFFVELLDLAKTNTLNDVICYDAACLLFHIINTLAEKRARGEVSSSLAKQIKQRLDGSVHGNVTIETIAAELSVSKAQVIKKFSEAYGESPYHYYLNRKIEVAKKLLKTTHMMVCEISTSLGFSDEHYFSNVFKEKTGLSPNAFRKQ
jgi:AraC-like DNA-binding protein